MFNCELFWTILVICFSNNYVISYPKQYHHHPLGFHVEHNNELYQQPYDDEDDHDDNTDIPETRVFNGQYDKFQHFLGKNHLNTNNNTNMDQENIENLNYTKFLIDNLQWTDQQQQNITFDNLKVFIQKFFDQQLQEISPNILRMGRDARGHKKKKVKKFLLPMILGALLVKSLILPVVLKGLALLSSKAVMISIVSLIVASISGLKRAGRQDEKTEVQVIHVPPKHSGYKRYDDDEHEEHYHSEYETHPSHHKYRAASSQAVYSSSPYYYSAPQEMEHYR